MLSDDGQGGQPRSVINQKTLNITYHITTPPSYHCLSTSFMHGGQRACHCYAHAAHTCAFLFVHFAESPSALLFICSAICPFYPSGISAAHAATSCMPILVCYDCFSEWLLLVARPLLAGLCTSACRREFTYFFLIMALRPLCCITRRFVILCPMSDVLPYRHRLTACPILLLFHPLEYCNDCLGDRLLYSLPMA